MKNNLHRLSLLCGAPLFAIYLTGMIAGSNNDEQYDHNGTPKSLPEKVTFNAHIRPIMSNTCFACHGPDEAANHSGLRLDSFDAAVAEGGAIDPGNAADSVVYQRLTDQEAPMPPAEFRHQLSEYEKALFKRWIQQGAKYEAHWAYTPVRRPRPPAVKLANRVANPIDAFVLHKLEMEGIPPTELADKATLLRRLSLDLTGLPPTPDELDAFLADESPGAYEKQVERLMASPKYGERMASRWLDIVRFSDTVGFHGDQNQRIFPYRDYVIQSLNDNQPFDEFTCEQLAGDLLDNPTDQQLVASGLIRLNMMTREGGAQPGEYLAKYTADRVRLIGTAWLGATTGCCECHNHKYDPFSIEDFYSLGAFFDDVKQWGVYQNYGYTPNPDLQGYSNEHPFPPEIRLTSESLKAQIRFLEKRLDEVIAATVPDQTIQTDEFKKWYAAIHSSWKQAPEGWISAKAVDVPEEASAQSDNSLLFAGTSSTSGQIEIPLKLDQETIVRSIRMEVLPSEVNNGMVGRSADGRFSVSLSATHLPNFDRADDDPVKMIPVKPRYVRIELEGRKILSLAEVQVFSGETNIAVKAQASQSSVSHDGKASLAIDGRTTGNYSEKSTTHTNHENNPWWELDLGEAKDLDQIVVWNRTDGNYPGRLNGFRVRLLDEDRKTLFVATPSLPSPSVEFAVPETVSEFDLLEPSIIAFGQADRFATNRYSNGYPSPFIQGAWTSGPSRWQLPVDENRLPHTAVYHLNEPLTVGPRDRLVIQLASNNVGRVRFSVSPVSRLVVAQRAFTRDLESAIEVIAGNGTRASLQGSQLNALKHAYYQYLTPLDQFSENAKKIRTAIANCRSGMAMSMVSQPIADADIRQARVLPRGDWQNESGKVVVANTPHFLAGYRATPDRRLTRLDLASWLMAPSNPLTARHYVNRTWKHFFGKGLSNVLDDLGNQGEWPSHPDLLDWLASEFQENWDRKHITRLIVTSNTYRQKAAVRSDLVERDPYNRLLAQQSARRLEAEAIRDSTLAISGLLQDSWVGGPSVFPYQPPGYYANLQFPNRRYVSSIAGLQYRRGVYMHWQRTFLHPMLANFDAPSRDECAADRTGSNSPQQALTLLNDPVFVEASRAFATRLITELKEADVATRISQAYRIALARQPGDAETATLVKLFQNQHKYFSEHPDEVKAFQLVGQFADDQVDPVEVAALAQVCRVILNLHETITRY